ncbi:hypothetical protein HGO23_14580 [Xenorhabdus budapestensis]|uniref:Uncharacterized protein n=1 Tax=Xenorhabdus budapestensis TaxID=290110 RepID=A0ABX7VEB6_XENBU|nr:hypothetical protein [Xenorhabdus budapestensis]QTL39068.1 hypothetical protein HGO23_14580 [Xenorhabdus budapestensis]
MKDIINYLIQNYSGVLELIAAFFSGVGITIHRVYKGITLFSNRKTSKNKHYLNEYSDVLNDKNKAYLKYIINEDVMFKVTKTRSPKLRSIIPNLEKDGVRFDYVRDIKRLNFYVSFNYENPIIKIDRYYKLNKFSEVMLKSIFFIAMIYISFLIFYFENKNSSEYYFLLVSMFITAIGVLSVYIMIASPSKKRIKKLNEILSKYKVDDTELF